MELTDRDELTNEEYDAKKKRLLKEHLQKVPKYSRENMLLFGEFVLQEAHKNGKSVDKMLLDWEKEAARITSTGVKA